MTEEMTAADGAPSRRAPHGRGRMVTVFGGSGFVGRHVVQALARKGWRVRVAVRRPDLAVHLQPLGGVGQIMAVQANLRFPQSVVAALHEADACVNLVGILAPSGAQGFEAVQARGAATVAEAAARLGIERLVHVSAIGADAESPSAYARSKAAGEEGVRAHAPGAVILRPSIVFGPEDDFFNRFAGLARVLPALPLVGGGETRFQPIYAGDVAEAVARALELDPRAPAPAADAPPGQARARAGETYELGGPAVRTFRELLELILRETGRRRALVPLPWGAARLQARGFELLRTLSLGLLPPDSLMLTQDQVALLERDNVVSDAAKADGRTIEAFGVAPATVEAIVPSYLWRFRKAGQFDRPTAP